MAPITAGPHGRASCPRSIYPDLPDYPSFSELVDHANRFVQHAHDRRVCCEYARTLLDDGQGINAELAAHHLRLIQQLGAAEACAIVQAEHRDSYLQPNIVKEEFGDFPEFETLLDLAVNGARIALPNVWVPNCGKHVALRPNAVRMAAPIHVRFAKEQALGDVIMVDAAAFREFAAASATTFSVISVDWVFKPGNKVSDLLGRLIDDYTNCDPPLNSTETFAAMESVYGELLLPQLPDMCRSLLTARETFPGQPIFGLKEDISRAYRRVRLAPTSCLHMVLQLPPHRRWRHILRHTLVPTVWTQCVSAWVGCCREGY